MDQNTETPIKPDDTAPAAPSIDYEAEATKMGWKPEANYKGTAPFVDAKTFYERGQEVIPIIKAALRSTQAELDRLKQSAAAALEVSERANAREVADLKAQLEQAKAGRAQAVKEADGEAFEANETAVKALEAQLAEAERAKPAAPRIDPQFQAWMEDGNEWYASDPVLRATANAVSNQPEFVHLHGKGRALWDAVAKVVKEKYMGQQAPRDVDRPGPSRAGRGNDTVGNPSPGKRSYNNLLPEFRNACDSQARDFGKAGDAKKLEAWRERYVAGCTDDAFRS